MMTKKEFIVDPKESFQRLDHFLISKTFLNKSQCQKLILQQKVLVNHQISKKSYLLKPQDLVTLQNSFPPTSFCNQKPYNLNLDIIYEDNDLVVINKPANLVVHPSLSFQGITLVNGLLYQINCLSHLDTDRPGIVHRLDKNTTGIILIAKNNDVSYKLQTAFQKRNITKIYWALIEGFIEDQGTIQLPIKRNPHNHLKMAVLKDGKTAITHFKTLKRFNQFSLIECNLKTGRTHQIRAHFSYLKRSILGDSLYGSRHYNTDLGQFLHAKKIIFHHPTNKQKLIFEAPLPYNFVNLLQTLTNQ